MNSKAKAFSEFLKKNEITCFEAIEAKDEFDSVVFRSNIEIEGQSLPTIVLLDKSIYGMVQVLLAPQALKESNEVELLKYINELNSGFKPFKYSFDVEKNLVLEVSLVRAEEEIDGEFIYAILEVIVEHLQANYGELMKKIWA